jgi:hypothetical protein
MTEIIPHSASRFSQLFDRIYILNLPDRADRRHEMLAELKAAHFPPPGKRVQFYPAIRPTETAGFPSIGARGCFLSHLGMLKQAKQDRLANVLILEDDLAFSPLLLRHDAELATLARDTRWDFAYFGHVLAGGASDEKAPTLESWDRDIVTTHFYAVRGPVIDPLIAFLESVVARRPGDPAGGPMHVDGALSTFRRQNPAFTTLVARPSLGGQRSSRSDVAPLKWFDKTPVIRQGISLLRSVRIRLQGRN